MEKIHVVYIDDDEDGDGSNVDGDGTLDHPFLTAEVALAHPRKIAPLGRGHVLDVHSRLVALYPRDPEREDVLGYVREWAKVPAGHRPPPGDQRRPTLNQIGGKLMIINGHRVKTYGDELGYILEVDGVKHPYASRPGAIDDIFKDIKKLVGREPVLDDVRRD